jgi:hypothetical protein
LEGCIQFLKRPDQIDRWYAEEGIAKGILDRGEFERFYLDEENLRQRAEKWMPNVACNVKNVAANFPETMNQCFWFFFASKTRESILMWSHYAKQHEGIVIEFDTDKSPFSYLPKELHLEVEYRTEKASFCYNSDDNILKKELLKVAKRKWKDWGYESEVRFAFPVSVCSSSKFVCLSPSAIRSVTFGCRHMKNGLTDDLRAFLEELHTPRFRHVGIWDAEPAVKEFRLEFVSRRSETL